MRLGIDASNLRAGGGATHLSELLRVAKPGESGFDEVIVWGGSAVLSKIEDRPWLTKQSDRMLEDAANPYVDRGQFRRVLWQRFRLGQLAKGSKCDALFAPGGLGISGFRPLITMCRNMLPFEKREAARYGLSLARARVSALRQLQAYTFRHADGLIFLTEYARQAVSRQLGLRDERMATIPHGVSRKFSFAPKTQKEIGAYTPEHPYRVLYVSTVDLYKHQWNVVEATARLREAGYPIVLDLVGAGYPGGLQRLNSKLRELPGASEFVHYRGAVPYDALHDLYRQADLKVFASSCENMPNILVEAMTAGLPIACSNRGPMPGVLGPAGAYFDPEVVPEIMATIALLIRSPSVRAENAKLAVELASQYSWERCARETFRFLAQCVERYHRSSPS